MPHSGFVLLDGIGIYLVTGDAAIISSIPGNEREPIAILPSICNIWVYFLGFLEWEPTSSAKGLKGGGEAFEAMNLFIVLGCGIKIA